MNVSRKSTTVIQTIGTIAAIAGVVCYYTGYPTITIICAVLTVLDSAVQVFLGDQNSFITEIMTIFIGLIIAFIAHTAIIPCMAVALCIGSVAMTIFGWLALLIM